MTRHGSARAIRDELAALRRAAGGLVALALLLPLLLGALASPDLVRDRALTASLQVLCGDTGGPGHGGAPLGSFGCALCPVACAAGCAVAPVPPATPEPCPPDRRGGFALFRENDLVTGRRPPGNGLPRGPPPRNV